MAKMRRSLGSHKLSVLGLLATLALLAGLTMTGISGDDLETAVYDFNNLTPATAEADIS